MKKIIISVLIVLLVASSAIALDLSSFPNMFLDEVRVVVGKSAAAEDVVGAIDIMAALQQRAGRFRRLDNAILDTEVRSLDSKNSIIIGGPCINSAAARVMGFPENCMEGFEMGKGVIKLYEFDNGKLALLAAGTTALDTRRVTTVLSNYKDYDLDGMEMVIAGLNINNINVNTK